MSATGFHPEPSAKAPWTRTIVLTAAYAGDDAAKAAPVRRARIKRFMVQPPLMLATVSNVAGARNDLLAPKTARLADVSLSPLYPSSDGRIRLTLIPKPS